MTRKQLIAELDEIREEIAFCPTEELTDRAREESYMCIVAAIDFLQGNEE